MSATKADQLPRPWPLLAHGQDPASLEARVAFHLHRLKLVGRPLHQAGLHKTDAADLAAGRSQLSQQQVLALANALRISREELVRDLTSDERRVWGFYRVSATDPQHVWNAARAAWTQRGLADKDAALIMQLKASTLSDSRRKRFVLNFEAALRLTTALNHPGGPEALLPLHSRDTEERSC